MARSRTPSALFALIAAFAGPCATALANHRQESLFQDDQYLIYSPASTVDSTLRTLRSLGVQRVRVTVKWADVAPAANSTRRPPSFNALDPSAYPPGVWRRYDDLVRLAARRRIAVEFNITAPGPLWAMQPGSPTTRAADHWMPNPDEFGRFVYAVGLRYGGRYAGLPAVHAWSIWNEPNQPGWLSPQFFAVRGANVPASPALYRSYVRAGFQALLRSKHRPGRDIVLIGELAPEGYSSGDFYSAMMPMPFVRTLYCVDRAYRPLQGASAQALGCPTRGGARAFVASNPGLFAASGFAHHPYYFFRPPSFRSPDPDSVPLANLGRLERGLDRAFRAYNVRRRIPIYLTEYGYQTNPPDPYQSVSTAEQAGYLNHADHMAWRDPRVRSVAQFLLYDTPPNEHVSPQDFSYWDTFQTGLLFADGHPKPALASYRVQIWASPTVRRGRRLRVWGQVRPAAGKRGQRAAIQWRVGHGRFRRIAWARLTPRGFLTATVRVRRSGELRITWRAHSGVLLTSRDAAVSSR